MSKASLKVGDKVRVKSHVKVPLYSWGQVKPGEVGIVIRVDKDGDVYADFPSQSSWLAHTPEMELVSDKRKSPEKVLAYGVLKDGELHKIVYDRDVARNTKARLGGKLAGATIVVLQAGKEIR